MADAFEPQRRQLEALYACNAWVMANMLEASRRLGPEQLTADRQGAHGSILATLGHVVGGHREWWAWLDADPSRDDPQDLPTLDDVEAAFREVSDAYRERVIALTAGEAARGVAYRGAGGATEVQTVGDVLLHVSLHTMNHLAQVATLLTQAAVEPPQIDYMAWVCAGRPWGRRD